MKLNDIFTNLKEKIDLTKNKEKIELEIGNFLSAKNLENIKNEKLDKLDLRDNVKLKVSKIKTKFFDSVGNRGKLKKQIDLKKTIINSNSIFSSIFGSKFVNFIQINSYNFINSKKPYKIIVILLVSFLLIIGDKYIVESLVKNGIKNLETLNQSQNLEELEKKINSSYLDFTIANILFKPFSLFSTTQVKNAENIIYIGIESSKTIKYILKTYKDINKEISNSALENIAFSEIISEKRLFFKEILENIKKINFLVNNINLETDNLNYKKFEKIKDLSNMSYQKINYLDSHFDDLLNLLGDKNTKKYFIVFQNNNEIRPTGGFMGSAGILEIFKGKIKSFEKKDIYAYEWDIDKYYKDKNPAPRGLEKVTDFFSLRDANFYIDSGLSASSINYFLQKGGYDVDGIIFINMGLVVKILEKTGDIYFDEIGETITANNFSEIFSILVEAKTYKVGTLGTPKQILFDFTKVLENKILNDGNLISYIKIILSELKKREVIIRSFSKKDDDLLKNLELAGNINFGETLDFSYPVFTSIGGNKTDRYVKRSYEKHITVNNDCGIDTNIRLSLNHNYSNEDKQRITKLMTEHNIQITDKLLKIQGDAINSSFVRILLPKDAEIIPFTGAEIKYFENSSYIDFYMYTNPGETKTYDISYRIKNPECKKYDFTLYKQPGIKNYNITIGDKNGVNEFKNISSDFNYIIK